MLRHTCKIDSCTPSALVTLPLTMLAGFSQKQAACLNRYLCWGEGGSSAGGSAQPVWLPAFLEGFTCLTSPHASHPSPGTSGEETQIKGEVLRAEGVKDHNKMLAFS